MFGKNNSKTTFAGLALHGDSLRYVALTKKGSSLQVVKQESVPLSPGGIVKESMQKVDIVEGALVQLKTQLGKFDAPVVLGIPSRDVILRLVEYPRMPITDVRDVLALEFDKYFPYSWDDAATDVAEVEVPSQGSSASSTVLVATCRRSYIREILRAVDRGGFHLSAVEPMNVALFRASAGSIVEDGAFFVVGIEPDVTHIILGYRDNGILYRSTLVDLVDPARRDAEDALMPILKDVQSTMIFAGNQYRGIAVNKIILGGTAGENMRLKSLLETGTTLPVVVSNVWTQMSPLKNSKGYDTAVGLALRSLS